MLTRAGYPVTVYLLSVKVFPYRLCSNMIRMHQPADRKQIPYLESILYWHVEETKVQSDHGQNG